MADTGTRKDPNRGMVVARETMVVIVGAKPPVYEQVPVRNNRTGEIVMHDKMEPEDPGSEGIPYTFKQYQRVAKTHPAVKQSPQLFLDVADLSDAELELVAS